MLAPERWARVRRLLEVLVELPVGQRLTYLADACPDDPTVRSEVESLLRAHDAAGPFLDPVPWSGADTGSPSLGEEPLTAGTCLGSFEIVEELGAGGMGRVYRVRDTRLDRTVALKVIAPALAGQPWHRERFSREARAISRLAHPNICVLHDVGHAAVDGRDRPFLVMELVDGVPLSTRLARGALPVDVTIDLARQMAEALAAAHAAGIVHGDLKPANIMLTRTGIKLLDFGLARLHDPVATRRSPVLGTATSKSGVIAGTLPYMAPEQLRGEDGDPRSDVFAFGGGRLRNAHCASCVRWRGSARERHRNPRERSARPDGPSATGSAGAGAVRQDVHGEGPCRSLAERSRRRAPPEGNPGRIAPGFGSTTGPMAEGRGRRMDHRGCTHGRDWLVVDFETRRSRIGGTGSPTADARCRASGCG